MIQKVYPKNYIFYLLVQLWAQADTQIYPLLLYSTPPRYYLLLPPY